MTAAPAAGDESAATQRIPRRTFWLFFWPLSLLGVATVSGRLVQNYVLMDFPHGVRELAAFALALAIYQPFQAALAFVPMKTNVLARSAGNRRAVLRFTLSWASLLTVPVVLLGWSELGPTVVGALYQIDPAVIERVLRYVRWLTPMVLLSALSHYLNGLLVQSHRTGWVTLLKCSDLALLCGVLWWGIHAQWEAVITVSLSRLAPAILILVCQGVLVARRYHAIEEEHEELKQRQIAAYFLPMSLNTTMFALSRPILFSYVTASAARGRLDGEATIAALGLAFSFAMLFQGTVNQFRHVSASFAAIDPLGTRRFIVEVTVIVVSLLILACVTPVNLFYFAPLQGASGSTLDMALQSMWILALSPAVVAWRNHYHGLAMVHRHTGAMAAGGVMRNVAIWLGCLLMLELGWLEHRVAAALLVLGFASEALTVIIGSRRWRAELRRTGSTTLDVPD